MEKITFDKEKHEYKLGDKVLPSVTQILESTLFEKKYEGVNDEVLMSAAKRGEYIHKEIETYIPVEEVVRIPVPQRKLKKRKLFTFLDEEE